MTKTTRTQSLESLMRHGIPPEDDSGYIAARRIEAWFANQKETLRTKLRQLEAAREARFPLLEMIENLNLQWELSHDASTVFAWVNHHDPLGCPTLDSALSALTDYLDEKPEVNQGPKIGVRARFHHSKVHLYCWNPVDIG